MIDSTIGCWALWGASPAGRFLLERRQVCAEFPLAVFGEAAEPFHSLLAHPSLEGIVLTVPPGERAARICAALAAGKSVLVEGWPCLHAAELTRIEDAMRNTGHDVGVFFTRPVEADFHAARAAIQTGRLGTLKKITYIACEFALPAGREFRDFLEESSADQLRNFLDLTGEQPDTVATWMNLETAGVQVRLSCPSGMTAWLEMHRRSFCGLRTGWVIEGSLGAYRQGRLMTLAADGELRDEAIAIQSHSEDVWMHLVRLVEDSTELETSWRRTADAIRLLDDCRRSQATGLPIVRSGGHFG